MSPTGDLLVTLIFAWGGALLSLLRDPATVSVDFGHKVDHGQKRALRAKQRAAKRGNTKDDFRN